MRRFAPPCLTDSLPLPSSTPSPQWLLELSLPLECITPVLGGGTRSRQPDALDPVRVSSLRGILRHWWRIVGKETDSAKLRAEEAALWGGVDLTPEDVDEIDKAYPGVIPSSCLLYTSPSPRD